MRVPLNKGIISIVCKYASSLSFTIYHKRFVYESDGEREREREGERERDREREGERKREYV